jgi:CubicO group peptidase (beta-lactamase class C family)
MIVRIATLFLLSFGSATAIQEEQPVRLGLGQVEGSIDAEAPQVYGLELPANQFIYGELNSDEIDSAITIFGPAGNRIGRYDNYGLLERFHFSSAVAGAYRIRVSIARGSGGRYTLQIMSREQLGTTPQERAGQLLKAYYRPKEPGGALIVIVGGGVQYSRSVGLANLTHEIPFTTHTAANIGSISKQFTAFAIALLEQQGKVSCHDEVRSYIPELRDYGTPVTLLHLLNHTGGYRDIFRTFPMKGVRGAWQRKELIESAQRQRELQNAPGLEYRYSNTGYILLAEVIERATHTSFSNWMKSNVFDPLGMDNTVVKITPGQVIPGSAQGYRRQGSEFVEKYDTQALYGASSIYSTVDDLRCWLDNFHDARVGGRELISRLTESTPSDEKGRSQYSFGLEIERHRGLLRYSHGGFDGGINSEMAYYPEIDGGLVLLFNTRIFPAVIDGLVEEFIGPHMTEQETPETPGDPRTRDVDSALLASYAGRYGGGVEQPLVLTFEVEGSHMRAKVENPNLPTSFPLQPVSDTTFVNEDIDIEVVFESAIEGKAPLVTFRWGGEDSTLQRLPAWEPSDQELRTYAGLYYSEELGMVYPIVVDNKKLKLRHPFMELVLTPKEPDAFVGPWLGDYRFKRGDDAKVCSFVVQSVTFEKLR